MKKVFTLLFMILGLLWSSNIYASEQKEIKTITNKHNIVLTEDKFLKLMDYGYTIREINNMTSEEINQALTTKHEGSITVKYFKTTTRNLYGKITSVSKEVSKDEYERGSSNRKDGNEPVIGQGTVETTYKKMISTVYTYDNTCKRLKTYLYWKQIPSKRSYDIISMSYSGNILDQTFSPSFDQLYTYNGTTYVDQIHYPKTSSGRGSALFKLPSDYIVTLCSEISIIVQKKNPQASYASLMAIGDYAHATSNISLNKAQNYSVGPLGIVHGSNSINYYDTIDTADAYFNW